MVVQLAELEEYCPNCGEWVSFLHFNNAVGWCDACVGSLGPRCSRCGCELKNAHRTICHSCRQEQWYELYADELEFLVVLKGYSLSRAKVKLAELVRPICQCCGKPINGASRGALFCKQNKNCHREYNRYRRLLKAGLTGVDALAIIKGQSVHR